MSFDDVSFLPSPWWYTKGSKRRNFLGPTHVPLHNIVWEDNEICSIFWDKSAIAWQCHPARRSPCPVCLKTCEGSFLGKITGFSIKDSRSLHVGGDPETTEVKAFNDSFGIEHIRCPLCFLCFLCFFVFLCFCVFFLFFGHCMCSIRHCLSNYLTPPLFRLCNWDHQTSEINNKHFRFFTICPSSIKFAK